MQRYEKEIGKREKKGGCPIEDEEEVTKVDNARRQRKQQKTITKDM